MQEQLWFLARLNPDLPIDNLPWLIDTPSSLDVPALKRSLQDLVQRHEALRTTYIDEDGRPVQQVHPFFELEVSTVSLEELPAGQQEPEMWRIIAAELRKPFDFEHRPPVRALLVRRSGRLNKLALIVNHIAIDTYSAYNVLFPELISLYNAYSAGEKPPSLPANLQIRHYAQWQRRRALSDDLAEHIRYWKHQLENLPTTLNLPTDRPRALSPTARGDERSHLLPDDLIKVVRLLGREEQATLFTVLLAAFFALLHRYTEQEDIFIGTAVADRGSEHKRSIFGPLINMVVLRAGIQGDLTFRQVVRRVRDVLSAARDHSELPFETLVNELGPRRSPGQNPLFQIAFNHLRSVYYPGWAITHRGPTSGTTDLDLIFDLQSVCEGICIHAQYSTDLFDSSTIEGMMKHYETLLRGAVEDADSCLWAMPLLTNSEREVLNDITASQMALFAPIRGGERSPDGAGNQAPFPRLFELQVEKSPDATAVLFGAEELSYWELNARANRLARRLRAMGVGPEILVGVCMNRSVDMVIALLAILKAGGAYVPLDPAYPADRLAFMLDDARPRVIITHKDRADSLPRHRSRVLLLDDTRGEAEDASPANLPPLAAASNLAYVIYTSGSTGRPKGVLIEHRGLSNLADAQRELFGVGPGSRVLLFASMSFDASVWEVAMALTAGAALVLGTRDSLMPGLPLLSLLREQEVTVITIPPSALNAMSHAPAAPEDASLPRLEAIIVAGEACPPELVARWAPGRRFFNAYGPTETTVCATVAECAGDAPKPLIGRPIKNVLCHLLDARMQPVPVGVPGELYIEGVGLARGYHNRPDLTAERFLPSKTVPGARMYRTGDLARYMPDGNIDFLGRVDRQVKIRGFRIEPGEIESRLRLRPEVRDAVVLPAESTLDEARLVAYIVGGPFKEDKVATDALRSYLEGVLPSYMVPSSFVVIDEIPTTPAGKIDHVALQAIDHRSRQRSEKVRPKGELELLIAGIWRRALRVDDVGVTENFFDLGGNSILLARVYDELRKSVNKSFTMTQLFTFTTIRSLAEFLGQISAESPSLSGVRERAEKQKQALERRKQHSSLRRGKKAG
jgi:amino acid adenylation domain-containing protein